MYCGLENVFMDPTGQSNSQIHKPGAWEANLEEERIGQNRP